jgi:RimJ/RimL family protein N-acetyltransferase
MLFYHLKMTMILLILFEIDLMISEKDYRSNGFGSESVYLIMYYCLKNFENLKEFIVKINEDNEASIKMFEKLVSINMII